MKDPDIEEQKEPESDPERGFLNVTDYNRLVHGEQNNEFRPLSVPQFVDPKKAYKFDERAREVYLRALAMWGLRGNAAHVAGVSTQTVNIHRRSDKDFARSEAEAETEFKGRLEQEALKQGMVGEWEPIVGRIGRDQDGIIGYKLKKNWDALRILLRKNVPAYRENGPSAGGGGDNGQKTGVLVVYPIMKVDEWAKATEGELLPRDPLHGIPGAEGLLLEDKTGGRRPPPEED